ncbi:proline-rich receptor-like protein kinase PERK8 [Odontomachus brunneus]|uniref:proline-rich receptor-like protein kinase PERK8 n=1 Tax=Odontomachus brunneus TaxID=486640 RepID=UPI0013F297FB|nr:proline-rich receptor-like protein kinase PERK8 [Odontomachus brunneus]
MAQPSNWYAIPGIEVLWSDLALSLDDEDTMAPTPPSKPSALIPPPTPPAIPPPIATRMLNRKVPSQGTRIQRSDIEQRRKAIMLTAPLPPPSGRQRRVSGTMKADQMTLRNRLPTTPPAVSPATPTASTAPSEKPKGHTTRPTDRGTSTAHRPEPLRAIGPSLPPPVRVEVQPGIVAEIPHFAVHVSRRYRLRLPQGRWMLRFNNEG